MANQLNYNGIIRSDADYMAKAQTLPQNDTADGNGGSFEYANTQASLEVIVIVNEEITLTDLKSLTIKLQDSADNSAFADLQTLYTKTSSGGDTIPADTELGRFVLPTTTKRYVKVVLISDDVAIAGKVDIFPTYLPR